MVRPTPLKSYRVLTARRSIVRRGGVGFRVKLASDYDLTISLRPRGSSPSDLAEIGPRP